MYQFSFELRFCQILICDSFFDIFFSNMMEFQKIINQSICLLNLENHFFNSLTL